jgi:hypothetical protein
MRNCNEFQEMLSLYVDDCLEPDEKGKLEDHLEKCSQCQQELKALQEMVNMFNSLQDEELIPPASFRRHLRQKLEKEQKFSQVSFFDKFLRSVNKSSFKLWMPLAAAALLLLIIVPVFINGIGPMGAQSAKKQAKMESAPAGYGGFAAVPEGRNFVGPEAKMKEPDKGAPDMYKMSIAEQESRSIASDTAVIERKIIKTGHLNLEVDSYKDTTTQINNMVQEMRGYVVSENTHIYDQERKLLAGSMALRIPHERFEEALNRLEKMGNANNRTVDSQDVTEEYVDVESRLRAMRLKEERLLAILNKSGSLGDILAVENELARTRADLEALEGRLRYLNNRTELSTINVTIKETLTPVKQIKTTGLQGIIIRTQEAFIKSINSIIIGTGNLIVYLGAYIPFVLLGLLALVILWVVFQSLFKKYKKSN